jgi:sugar (pentulose or hexulose) kinase
MNRPDLWSRTHKLIGVQDWALYLLTGRFVTDQTFGSRTNLLDLKRRTWDPDLLSLFQVEARMLCELVAPGSIVGGLTNEMAMATGLTEGLPVVTAGGDQQCAALGLGLFSGERAVSNTGTGSYLIGHADKPTLDEGMRLACNVSAVPGAYIVEAAVLTSGTIYRWFKETLFNAVDSLGDPFEAINAEAERVSPGSNGLLLLPHFKGCGAPHWDPEARGVFFNLTLSTTRGEMARAILEGIAIEMKESLELVENLCGAVRSVTVSGGMTKSALFNQISSDVFERPVVHFSNNEATSLGAWIAGAVATGLETSYPTAFSHATRGASALTFRPSPENHEAYERQHRRSRALYQALAAPEFRELFK